MVKRSLYTGLEYFEEVVEGLVIAELALRPALGQRQMRQEKSPKPGKTTKNLQHNSRLCFSDCQRKNH
jgi:hypothetical protein